MTADRRPQSVFVLAGQSNMAGRGGVHNAPDGGKVWDGIQPDLKSPGMSPGFSVICTRSPRMPAAKFTWGFEDLLTNLCR